MRRCSDHILSILMDFDLLVLLLLLLADVRVFEGSSVSSFTIYELAIWLYCAPWVVGSLLRARLGDLRFVAPVSIYLAWMVVAAVMALAFRRDSEVLQQVKNIVPILPLICFLMIRIQRSATTTRLINFYILYCLGDSILAILQYRQGGPYLRPAVENNEYKLDFVGSDFVNSVVVGFSSTPNQLAIAILPGVMFAAIKLYDEVRRFSPRLTTLVCLMMTSIALVLTQSRGAIVWLVVGFLVTIGPRWLNRSFMLKLIVVGVVIVGLTTYGVMIGDGTTIGRYQLWRISISGFATDFYEVIFGDGFSYMRQQNWTDGQGDLPDAHNGWLDQAIFFGMPAMLFYLLIWWRFFSLTDRWIGGPQQVLLDGIRGSVLGLMGASFFEPVGYVVFPVALLFFLMTSGIIVANLVAPSRDRTLVVAEDHIWQLQS